MDLSCKDSLSGVSVSRHRKCDFAKMFPLQVIVGAYLSIAFDCQGALMRPLHISVGVYLSREVAQDSSRVLTFAQRQTRLLNAAQSRSRSLKAAQGRLRSSTANAQAIWVCSNSCICS